MKKNIDWTDPACATTEHFTVGDAILLRSWKRLAIAEDGVDFDQVLKTLEMAEKVRVLLGCPMHVTSLFRSKEYNKSQGIKEYDVHARCLAIDFHCLPLLTCDQVKVILEPQLESLGIRMERNGTGAGWVHLDLYKVGPSGRYFTP